jgi:hypothetical protein
MTKPRTKMYAFAQTVEGFFWTLWAHRDDPYSWTGPFVSKTEARWHLRTHDV